MKEASDERAEYFDKLPKICMKSPLAIIKSAKNIRKIERKSNCLTDYSRGIKRGDTDI